MAETNAKQRPPRRRWAPAEKRRIVELTLREGASVVAVAREYGVNPNNLRQWQAQYQAGRFDTRVKSAPLVAESSTSSPFVPVKVVNPTRTSRYSTGADSQINGESVVQLMLASGATLRIETTSLDSTFVCNLVAELQR